MKEIVQLRIIAQGNTISPLPRQNQDTNMYEGKSHQLNRNKSLLHFLVFSNNYIDTMVSDYKAFLIIHIKLESISYK
jgi:hypothetical protein